MPLNDTDSRVYRKDVKTQGNTLSTEEREAIIKKYLPVLSEKKPERKQSVPSSQHRTSHRRRVRPFIAQKLHILIYLAIQFVFGIYIRLRQIASALSQKFIAIRHYHHRTPAYIQRDLKNLSRIPEHLSIVLKYDASEDGALESLLDEVAELSAWSTAAGIPLLSVYEKSGALKQYMSALSELVHQKLVQYFGPAPNTPTLRVYAPNLPSLSPIQSPRLQPQSQETNGHTGAIGHLNLLLLSQSDGRDTLVDLTRTLTEMSQSHKIRPKDITCDLIDTEISATTSIPSPATSPAISQTNVANGNAKPTEAPVSPSDPDLLIVFAPYVKLEGYPPWQLRLTEIFCVGDSGGDVSGRTRTRVEYQGFIRGLWNYAGAQFRFGR